jgi:hypothetical protein
MRILKAECRPWLGPPAEYQQRALTLLEDMLERVLPWRYAIPLCGTEMCCTDFHLVVHQAREIAYPAGVCIYCGMPASTKDHLLPVTMTGDTVRKFVAVVPSCIQCNSAIGDRVGYRVTERRAEAHRCIERKNRKLLVAPRWTEDDLDELGPLLRFHVEDSVVRREVVEHRLSWPFDFEYDKRAFQKSGFADPIAMELL